MKGLILSIAVMCTTVSLALADWTDVFYSDYNQKGIDHAVVVALGSGKSPDQIIKTALPITNLKKENLVKALFCSQALPGNIYDAAESNGISDSAVSQGYELALAECAEKIEEKLNSAVNPTTEQPESAPSKRVRGPNYSSPWKFE